MLTVGSGKITLVGAKGKTLNIKGTLEGGNVGATINNSLSSKAIYGTSYADSIYNTGNKVTISTGAANDTVTTGAVLRRTRAMIILFRSATALRLR